MLSSEKYGWKITDKIYNSRIRVFITRKIARTYFTGRLKETNTKLY